MFMGGSYAAGLMADEMTPWYTASWNFFIPQRLSYTIDFGGAFSHPKVCATLSPKV